MADKVKNAGKTAQTGQAGWIAFLPYGLPVLGGAIGMAWARWGTDAFNPMAAVAAGAVAGRLIAVALVRRLEAARARRRD